MSRYEVQVLVHGRWTPLRPTGGTDADSYRYDTIEEAERTIMLCYPGDLSTSIDRRITRIDDLNPDPDPLVDEFADEDDGFAPNAGVGSKGDE